MIDWAKVWTSGACEGCGEKFKERLLYRGKCVPCRQPEDRRELVKFGVPCSTADGVASLMKRCGNKAEFVLAQVRPRLMENVQIVDGHLKVRDKSYHWARRVGWEKNR